MKEKLIITLYPRTIHSSFIFYRFNHLIDDPLFMDDVVETHINDRSQTAEFITAT